MPRAATTYPEYDHLGYRPGPRALKRWFVTAKYSRRGGAEILATATSEHVAKKIAEALQLLDIAESETE